MQAGCGRVISTPSGVKICLGTGNIDLPKQLQLRSCRTLTKRQTRLGLLDLNAAFDTFDHRILLDRLRHDYGVRGPVIQWIESYLTGRSKLVRFNGVTSKTVPVTPDVPQGSVLGLILFIYYSDEIVAIVQHQGFKVHAFADDLQIYGSTAQNGAADLYIDLYRVRRVVQDELKSTQSQFIQDRVDLAKYQSPITALRRTRPARDVTV